MSDVRAPWRDVVEVQITGNICIAWLSCGHTVERRVTVSKRRDDQGVPLRVPPKRARCVTCEIVNRKPA